MANPEFHKLEPPMEVVIELLPPEQGGRHTPVVPEENFRPNMYFGHNDRQFWGQLNVSETTYPGESGRALLKAVYPPDLEDSFVSGSIIKLHMASLVGIAKIL